MKKYIFLLALPALMIACAEQTSENKVGEVEVVEEKVETDVILHYYGDTISAEGAIEANKLFSIVKEQGGFEGTVKSTIHETCQKKGCWMMVDAGNGEEIRVRFKDYGFFVPTEGVEDMEVIMHGQAYLDTTTVDMLRHYAEDAGKSKEEIEAITEPEYALAFEATGVIIKE